MLELDHIAVAANTLDEGRAYVEQTLGITLAPGGQHPLMGTHNLLVGLEDGLYFEVIAIDPDAPKPPHPRWFDLDNFAGPPRLTNWVCRCPDIAAVLAQMPDVGTALDITRGDLRWFMGVPEDGRMPFDNIHPVVMQWQGDAHPAPRLPQSGARLTALRVFHPQADALRDRLAPHMPDARISYHTADAPALEAVFDTPHGERVLR